MKHDPNSRYTSHGHILYTKYNMLFRFVISTLLFLGSLLALGKQAPTKVDPLEGVWEASSNLGPWLRGRIQIWDFDGKYEVEIGGYSALCEKKGSALEAVIAGGLGRFRGAVLPNGDIEGHWVQPNGTMTGYPFASPVTLARKAAGLWVGEIHPLDDEINMFLVVKKGQDGKLATFIRNPDRNLGVFLQADELVSDSNGVRLMGRYRGSKDVAELARGSYDADNTILSLYFSARGVSMDFTRVDQNDVSEFYPRPKGQRTYRYEPPKNRADGWDVGPVQGVGISAGGVDKFGQMLVDMPDESVHALNVHAALIARYGKLVFEEYFHGFSADKPHDLRSAAKSLTSILAGVAMDENKSFNLKTRVLDVLHPAGIDTSDPRKAQITVENLLTMSAGLDCDDSNDASPGNEDVMQSQNKDLDFYHYALNVPMAFDPGAKAVYGSALPNLLGGMIAAETKSWIPELFRDKLARPLGIEDYYIPINPGKQPYMGGGIHLKARDFMKFGQMMLNGGTWRGRRLLSKSFVEDSTRIHYPLEGLEYGYLWWIVKYPFHGQILEAYFAGGNGGQVLMVIPKLSLVFECLAGNYSDKVMYSIQRDWVPKYVLPMIDAEGK